MQYDDEEVYDLRKRSSELFATVQRKDFFNSYVSKYSGSFDLMNSFRIPRPCAYKSINMTSVEYYRGQNTLTYDVFDKNGLSSIFFMRDTATLQYQNGEPSTDIASLDLDRY